MKQDILPFKIGMQYENWEFSLEPINEERSEGFDSYLCFEKLLCEFILPVYLELLFSLDILKVIVYVVVIEKGEELRQLRVILEERFRHKFFKRYNSRIEILNISESIDNKKVSCFTFDEFWDKYPNKTARAESQKKYDLLTETDRELIKNTIDYFINNKPFEKYSYPMATTYINQKRWLDIIVQPKQEVTQPEIFDFSKPTEQGTAIKF